MSIGRCTACVIAFLNLIWMQHNNACEAVILESSDENLYSIGLSHAQPWASLNAMNDLIDRINTKLLNKKLLSATMYNDGSDMPEEQSVNKRYSRIGGTIVMGRRK